MRSDTIHVTNQGKGIDRALEQADAVAVFKSLDKKCALQLRLLTEEMMGMIRTLTGKREAVFWIEDVEGTLVLHLKTDTIMNTALRKQLLSATTSGSNAAAKGVMGKIRDLFERSLEPYDSSFESSYAAGWTYMSEDPLASNIAAQGVWSFNKYKLTVGRDGSDNENWDELEKSIIANVADEVEIAIYDNTVEMIVYKKIINA